MHIWRYFSIWFNDLIYYLIINIKIYVTLQPFDGIYYFFGTVHNYLVINYRKFENNLATFTKSYLEQFTGFRFYKRTCVNNVIFMLAFIDNVINVSVLLTNTTPATWNTSNLLPYTMCAQSTTLAPGATFKLNCPPGTQPARYLILQHPSATANYLSIAEVEVYEYGMVYFYSDVVVVSFIFHIIDTSRPVRLWLPR